MSSSQTAAPFIPLSSPDELEAAVTRSFERPVLLFKHSTTCGTSAQAYDEMEDYRRGDSPVEVHVIDVHAARTVARTVAERFGIRHESPQVLLLVNGTVRWHASHYRVSGQAVERALLDLRSPDQDDRRMPHPR